MKALRDGVELGLRPRLDATGQREQRGVSRILRQAAGRAADELGVTRQGLTKLMNRLRIVAD